MGLGFVGAIWCGCEVLGRVLFFWVVLGFCGFGRWVRCVVFVGCVVGG